MVQSGFLGQGRGALDMPRTIRDADDLAADVLGYGPRRSTKTASKV
jgi:hypothetical protein